MLAWQCVLPMEKGTKALSCPFSSRKCWGLKFRGLEKNLGSLSMQPSIGKTLVPWLGGGRGLL